MIASVLGLVDRVSRSAGRRGGWSDGWVVFLARSARLWLGRCCVLGFAAILAVVNGIGWGVLVWGVWVLAGFLESRHVRAVRRRLPGEQSLARVESDYVAA